MLIANRITPPRSGRRDSLPDGGALREVSAITPPGTPYTDRAPVRFTPDGKFPAKRVRQLPSRAADGAAEAEGLMALDEAD